MLVVSYVEATPVHQHDLARTLIAYGAELERKDATASVDVLQELGRGQRMAIVEHWPNGTPSNSGIAEKTSGLVQAPIDRRENRAVGSLLSGSAAASFHMLMHVDVVPAGAQSISEALDRQRIDVLAAPGAVGYEVAVQSDKPNHFEVHELWSSRTAYEAYAALPAARALRDKLANFKGALFDDRFFISLSKRRAMR